MKNIVHNLWLPETPSTRFPTLTKELKVDVAIVGGGVTGLSTALCLQRQGKNVVLIERNTIGSGETGHTTAHVTEILDTRYADLYSKMGLEKARLIRSAQAYGIEQTQQNIREFDIKCDFKSCSGFLFTDENEHMEEIRREKGALLEVGSSVGKTNKFPINFPVKEFLEVTNQGELNPIKYVDGLADAFTRLGGLIFEHTTAIDFDEKDECEVKTEQGKLTAKSVVVAAHNPVNNRLLIQTKIASYRSYAIGLKLKTMREVPGLFWDTQDPYHYIRQYNDVIIVGGEDHKVGLDSEVEAFQNLEAYARRHFRQIESIPYHWSGQIIETLDGLPYIGRNSFSKNYYVATGFSGNGFTYAPIAAKLISDQILGVENSWESLFDPTRIDLKGGVANYVAENIDFPVCMISDRLASAPEYTDVKLGANEGAIVKMGKEKVAVCRNKEGELKYLSPVCPHMGCLVRFNKAEASWDCPCHGSRFDCDGHVLNGPAVQGLKELPMKDKEIGSERAA